MKEKHPIIKFIPSMISLIYTNSLPLLYRQVPQDLVLPMSIAVVFTCLIATILLCAVDFKRNNDKMMKCYMKLEFAQLKSEIIWDMLRQIEQINNPNIKKEELIEITSSLQNEIIKLQQSIDNK